MVKNKVTCTYAHTHLHTAMHTLTRHVSSSVKNRFTARLNSGISTPSFLLVPSVFRSEILILFIESASSNGQNATI